MQKRIVPFHITHMDSLGQGVSKETDKITFIEKTLPGEQGQCQLLAEKKGVAFARVQSLTQASPARTEAACPHFEQCPSCHYQHTDYQHELQFKAQNLERMLRKLPHPELEVFPAPQRLGYRNRIQLHYDLPAGLLGMLDAKLNQILPVPECLIGVPMVQQELQRLYHQQRWQQEAPADTARGHVEIYATPEGLRVSWNQPYASGGFTQVFDHMNQLMRSQLQQWAAQLDYHQLLDLFAGNGNLSQQLSFQQRLCVDMYPPALPGADFFSQNLYAAGALKQVERELQRRQLKPEVMLLDPPRSGLKDLAHWVQVLKPRYLAYVSCDPHTLVRDVAQLSEYSTKRVLLMDFFPATWHFETLLLMERQP
jgi:23S rRNA (uracil1939-C5)-methyltransferase